jgi:hypothetical protein
MTGPDIVETIELDDRTFDVITRQKARGINPLNHSEMVTLPTVDELLLNTGDSVYQCAHPNRGDCRKVFRATTSVTAHQRSHGSKTLARQAAKELAKVQAEKSAEFARRSNGVTTANEAKRNRHKTEVTSPRKDVAALQRKISDLAHGIEKIAATLPPLAVLLRDINAELAELPDVDIDPAVVEKAKRYDALKGLIND